MPPNQPRLAPPAAPTLLHSDGCLALCPLCPPAFAAARVTHTCVCNIQCAKTCAAVCPPSRQDRRSCMPACLHNASMPACLHACEGGCHHGVLHTCSWLQWSCNATVMVGFGVEHQLLPQCTAYRARLSACCRPTTHRQRAAVFWRSPCRECAPHTPATHSRRSPSAPHHRPPSLLVSTLLAPPPDR